MLVFKTDFARELAQVGLADFGQVLMTRDARTRVVLHDFILVPEAHRPAVGIGSRDGSRCVAAHTNEPSADVATLQVIKHRQTLAVQRRRLLSVSQEQHSRVAADVTGTASHEHLSEVREPYLRNLAREVGFEYLHLSTLDSIREAMLHPRFAEQRRAPTDFAWVAALAALVTLIASFTRARSLDGSYRIRTDPNQ